jgi:hypothetical protein
MIEIRVASARKLMRVPGLAIAFPFATPGRSKTAAVWVTVAWAYSVYRMFGSSG